MHFSCSLIKLLITSVECEWRLWGTTVRSNILINFPQIGLVSFYCFAIRFVFHRLRLFSLALTHTATIDWIFTEQWAVCVDVSVAVIVFYCCWFGVVFACFYVIARARERVGETHYTYLYMYTYLLLQLLRIFHFTNEIQYKQYH